MISNERVVSDRKYNSLDLFKFLMAIAVVAIHTCPLIKCRNENILSVYTDIVNLAVPFFFMSTGFLLQQKMKGLYKESDVTIIKNQFIKILRMYLLWMVIYTPLSIWHSVVTKTSFFSALTSYIIGLFFLGEQYNSWPLWYLLSTLYSFLLIMILVKRKLNLKGWILVSLFFLNLSIGINYFVSLENVDLYVGMIQKLIKYTISNARIFSGMIYIPAGMYLAHQKFPRVLNICLFFGGGIINFFVESGMISSYILFLMMIGFFGIIQNIELKNNKIYALLRTMSTIIYLIHMYVWSFYYKIFYGKKTFGADSFIVTVIVSSTIAFAYVTVINKYRRENCENIDIELPYIKSRR